MAALSFLKNSKRRVKVAYFDHGTEHGRKARKFVSQYCSENKIGCIIGYIKGRREKGESLEEFWRNQRNAFFKSFGCTVITAHNLDDACEWWVFTSLHGYPRLIPSSNENILRPFLLNSKQKMEQWCVDHNIPFINDPSNDNRKFMRSIIRHELIPIAEKINPGLRKVILKKMLKNLRCK